jgi:spore coat polysaccharide biosynthesis predicted glycosyltransferase SpsG
MFMIHAAGGSETGIGHLSRSRSVAAELIRLNAGPVVLVYEAPPEVAERFSSSGARVIVASSRASALEIRERALRELGSAHSVLITDLLRLGANDAVFARRQGFQVLVHLNDSGLSAYAADLTIDGDAFKGTQQVNKGLTKYLCGALYHIVDPSVACRRPVQPWSKATVEKVLVSLGGADPDQQTEFLVREIRKCPSSVEFTVVAGPAFSPARCELLASQVGSRCRLLRSCLNMADTILEHDAVVTLGGLTSYEAMCLGRAVFAVAWAHMAPYVEQLDAVGLLKNLGLGEGVIENLYASLADAESVWRLARSGWEAIDGRGAERVVGVILNEYKA